MLLCLLLEVFVFEIQFDFVSFLKDEGGIVDKFTELRADVGRYSVFEIAAEFPNPELILTQVCLLLIVNVVNTRKEQFHEIALLLYFIDFFLYCL